MRATIARLRQRTNQAKLITASEWSRRRSAPPQIAPVGRNAGKGADQRALIVVRIAQLLRFSPITPAGANNRHRAKEDQRKSRSRASLATCSPDDLSSAYGCYFSIASRKRARQRASKASESPGIDACASRRL